MICPRCSPHAYLRDGCLACGFEPRDFEPIDKPTEVKDSRTGMGGEMKALERWREPRLSGGHHD